MTPTMTLKELGDIMHRADRYILDNGTDQLNIRTEDINNDLLALCHGFKWHGGEVYVAQTFDLRTVCFDLSEYNWAYAFFAYAMTVLK